MADDLHDTANRPLDAPAKLALMAGAAGIILACYLFAIVSTLTLVIWIALEFVVMLVFLRFGLAGLILSFLQRHIRLVIIFGRNLWLPRGVDYQIPLDRGEAAQLFALLDKLATKLSVSPPHKVAVEMNAGAWVRLHGLRRGAGYTVLGIGYDLLAALDVAELEAVMAHEMTHAKLVARGLKSALNGGLARIARVAGALKHEAEAHRRAQRTFATAAFLGNCADSMTRVAARLVSAYSRQDEFEADRGAASVCGSSPIRTSLLRLGIVESRLARLPWAERTIRVETEPSFSQWLVDELTVSREEAERSLSEETRDPYSTHPSLHDRLAVLPSKETRSSDTSPAIRLLSDPDEVARRLLREINEIARKEEEKDTRRLAVEFRKFRGGGKLRWRHIPGICLLVLGFIVLAMFLISSTREWMLVPVAAAFFVASRFALKFGRYRPRRALPVPKFAEIMRVWRNPPQDVQEREARTEAELKERGWSATRKKFGAAELVNEAFTALSNCDYLRAHVTTRYALGVDSRDVEAALGHSIANAGLGSHQTIGTNLQFVRENAGFSNLQTIWGAAWTLVLAQDWNNAEMFLQKAHELDASQPTFLLLLGLAQMRRGKFQSAIRAVEGGIALAKSEPESARLLAECLLTVGRADDAAQKLAEVTDASSADPAFLLLMVRARLLQRDREAADSWAEKLKSRTSAPIWDVRLGEAFETARHDDVAATYYERALENGFHPEAHVGLARIAARRENQSFARKHLHSALNLESEPAQDATGPLPLFHNILSQLLELNGPRRMCRAWIVTCINAEDATSPAPLRLQRMMVFAETRETAAEYLREIFSAMEPSRLTFNDRSLVWNEAPKEEQPVRPVFPGVQFVLEKK